VPTLAYDAENHLTATGGQTYLYDGDGKRVEKATTGTPPVPNKLYWYDQGGNVIYETDASGNELYRYYYFAGRLVDREEANDWVDHYALDALGNVRWLYSLNGGVDVIDYYPFGGERLIHSTSAGNNTRLFTGLERDSESNLDHTLFRQYSSSLGRWMAPDPAGLAAVDPTNPQSWNRYAYVLNNPLELVDPFGLDCVFVNDSGDGVEDIAPELDAGACGDQGGVFFAGSIDPSSLQFDPNSDFVFAFGTASNSQFSCGGAVCGQGSLDGFANSIFGSSAIGVNADTLGTSGGLFSDDGTLGWTLNLTTSFVNGWFTQGLSDQPGSCTAVFLNSAQSSGKMIRSAATSAARLAPALARALPAAGPQAEEVIGAMVAGGQLNPAAGAVLTNIIEGTAPLAAAAAPYLVRGTGYLAAAGLDIVAGKALYDELAAIRKGTCKP
jgi:RHS repeat-associated protein